MEELFAAFGINWKLLLFQAVNFGLLLAGLTFFLYKPVLKMLRERQALVEKGVKDAEEAERKVKEIEHEKGSILQKAERAAEEAVAKGVEAGKRERQEIVERAQTQSDTILSDARLQADEIARKAVKAAEKEIAEAAILAAEKILKTK